MSQHISSSSSRIPNYSHNIPDTALLYSREFIQGAGVIIFHRSTKRVVLVIDNDQSMYGWFLPKGRKNVGERIEETAMREGKEESGFENTLLPVPIEHHCPPASDTPVTGNNYSTEPIYMYLQRMPKSRRWPYGGSYLCYWFISEVSDEEVARVEALSASASSPSQAFALEQTAQPKDASEQLAGLMAGLGVGDDQGNETSKRVIDQHELGYEAKLFTYDDARTKMRRNATLNLILELAIQKVEQLDYDAEVDDVENRSV